MEKSIRWLRVSYRAGAILDLLAAIQMIIPAVFAATSGISDFHPGREYFYAGDGGCADAGLDRPASVGRSETP
jgi:hypothetical protein